MLLPKKGPAKGIVMEGSCCRRPIHQVDILPGRANVSVHVDQLRTMMRAVYCQMDRRLTDTKTRWRTASQDLYDTLRFAVIHIVNEFTPAFC